MEISRTKVLPMNQCSHLANKTDKKKDYNHIQIVKLINKTATKKFLNLDN